MPEFNPASKRPLGAFGATVHMLTMSGRRARSRLTPGRVRGMHLFGEERSAAARCPSLSGLELWTGNSEKGVPRPEGRSFSGIVNYYGHLDAPYQIAAILLEGLQGSESLFADTTRCKRLRRECVGCSSHPRSGRAPRCWRSVLCPRLRSRRPRRCCTPAQPCCSLQFEKGLGLACHCSGTAPAQRAVLHCARRGMGRTRQGRGTKRRRWTMRRWMRFAS